MRRVFTFIEKYRLIEAGDRVLVGVSGGADSICLLFLLLAYRERVPFTVEAVHVEHGVRGRQSLEDAAFVRACCEQQGVPFHMISYDVPRMAKEQRRSVEEMGRILRHGAFARIAAERNLQKIALAHHKNDQAETVLANLARGAGLGGAGAIRPMQGRTIRPLLCVTRGQIEEWLLERGLSWRHDATNDETEYTRNFLRHEILPRLTQHVNARTTEHLAELAEDMQKADAFLRAQAQSAVEQMTVQEDARGVWLANAQFEALEKILQEYAVRICLERVGCGLKDISREHVRAVCALAKGQSGRKIALPCGYFAGRTFDRLWICAPQAGREADPGSFAPRQIPLPGELTLAHGRLVTRIFENKRENISCLAYTKWLNYDKIGSNLQVRTRQAGDYLVINREGGRKKLKRYFVEEQIPREQRDRILLIAQGSEILWVIGYRISEAYKVTEDTNYILEIQVEDE